MGLNEMKKIIIYIFVIALLCTSVIGYTITPFYNLYFRNRYNITDAYRVNTTELCISSTCISGWAAVNQTGGGAGNTTAQIQRAVAINITELRTAITAINWTTNISILHVNISNLKTNVVSVNTTLLNNITDNHQVIVGNQDNISTNKANISTLNNGQSSGSNTTSQMRVAINSSQRFKLNNLTIKGDFVINTTDNTVFNFTSIGDGGIYYSRLMIDSVGDADEAYLYLEAANSKTTWLGLINYGAYEITGAGDDAAGFGLSDEDSSTYLEGYKQIVLNPDSENADSKYNYVMIQGDLNVSGNLNVSGDIYFQDGNTLIGNLSNLNGRIVADTDTTYVNNSFEIGKLKQSGILNITTRINITGKNITDVDCIILTGGGTIGPRC